MIEEHLWQEGDQVQAGNHVYRLDRLAIHRKEEKWFGWREQDGTYMAIPQPMSYTGYSEKYLPGVGD
jgi:hypothetical protein